MARFERSKGGKSSSRGGPRSRDTSRSSSRGNGSRGTGRDSRDSPRSTYGDNRRGTEYIKDRKELTMTKTVCDSCGERCEVPFKPTTNKPIYCRACYSKQNDFPKREESHSPRPSSSNRDLEMINDKLNKIMKALNIRS